MSETHDLTVELLSVSPIDQIFRDGETFTVKVAILPQNRFLARHTQQILFYVGLRGGTKTKCLKIDMLPKRNPEVQKAEFSYTISTGIFAEHCASFKNILILEIGWCEAQNTSEPHLLYTVPVAKPWGKTHEFIVGLCTPLPEVVAGGNVLVLDLATSLQNTVPRAPSQLFVYVKEKDSDIYDVCCIEDENGPGANPPLRRGGVAYYVSEHLVGKTLEIGWACDVGLFRQGAIDKFKDKLDKQMLGTVKVVQHKAPPQRKVLPRKMKRFVKDHFEKPVNAGLTREFCRLIATELTKARLTQAVLQKISSMEVPEFATRLNASGDNFARLILYLGEEVGSYVGGNLGKELGAEEAGRVIGELGGAIVTGAALGSVVPGVGTAAGAACGAVSWSVGKATEKVFSLF